MLTFPFAHSPLGGSMQNIPWDSFQGIETQSQRRPTYKFHDRHETEPGKNKTKNVHQREFYLSAVETALNNYPSLGHGISPTESNFSIWVSKKALAILFYLLAKVRGRNFNKKKTVFQAFSVQIFFFSKFVCSHIESYFKRFLTIGKIPWVKFLTIFITIIFGIYFSGWKGKFFRDNRRWRLTGTFQFVTNVMNTKTD